MKWYLEFHYHMRSVVPDDMTPYIIYCALHLLFLALLLLPMRTLDGLSDITWSEVGLLPA